jgi:hypothetical protein
MTTALLVSMLAGMRCRRHVGDDDRSSFALPVQHTRRPAPGCGPLAHRRTQLAAGSGLQAG